MTGFDIHFHGVRGSLASPGTHTAGVGGNTSCVEINAGSTRIVLDAGTGLRSLGERLLQGGSAVRRNTSILLSHVHWDHIQGLPFFSPIYVPGWELEVISGPNGIMPLEEVLRRQMSPPFFPVAFDDLASRVRAVDARPGTMFPVGADKDVVVTMARLNHPDPVYGYRIEWNGRSVVYATDTEHYSCVDPTLRKLAEGADVLIYDAQYTPEEYRGEHGAPRVGWGHSTFEAAVELARAAEVGNLVLFHHDPRRGDDEVADIEARARELFPHVVAAREGVTMPVDGRAGHGADQRAGQTAGQSAGQTAGHAGQAAGTHAGEQAGRGADGEAAVTVNRTERCAEAA